MNCTVHPESAATAYCRTCGKALCERCARTVHGVVYCEECIAARLSGTAPPATAIPVVVTSGPSPGLAAVLSIFFPFGVGQVYNGQYAKGLAHMLVFIALVAGVSAADSGGAATHWYGPVFGLGIAFFYVYQIIDAVRSAHAIRLGQPAPDPFGLGVAFSSGQRINVARVPVGAVILIALGIIFLLNTMGLLHFFWVGRLWPLILIAIGVWLLIKRFAAPPAGGVTSA